MERVALDKFNLDFAVQVNIFRPAKVAAALAHVETAPPSDDGIESFKNNHINYVNLNVDRKVINFFRDNREGAVEKKNELKQRVINAYRQTFVHWVHADRNKYSLDQMVSCQAYFESALLERFEKKFNEQVKKYPAAAAAPVASVFRQQPNGAFFGAANANGTTRNGPPQTPQSNSGYGPN